MATTATVVVPPNRLDYKGVVKYTWTLANGETGEAVPAVNHADRSVQVKGTFGAGGTVLIEGSLDAAATTFATLTDQNDNALSITAAKIESVQQLTDWFRPRVSAGDATTALTITLTAKC